MAQLYHGSTSGRLCPDLDCRLREVIFAPRRNRADCACARYGCRARRGGRLSSGGRDRAQRECADLAGAARNPSNSARESARPDETGDHASRAAREKRIAVSVRCDQPPGSASPSRASSSAVSSSSAAATFSSRCSTELVPGIGSITGARASSQANATCPGVASCATAISASVPPGRGVGQHFRGLQAHGRQPPDLLSPEAPDRPLGP
jgi:hypothetical protein